MEVCFGIVFPLINLNYYKVGYSVNMSYYTKHFKIGANFSALESRGANSYKLSMLGIGISKDFGFLGFSIYEFFLFRKYESFYEYGFNPSLGFSIKLGKSVFFKTENNFIFGKKKILPLMSILLGIKT
ncbi:MAG: hypothetical protein N2504_01440 [candidate division WOR-3 bacterium]|nr:hypothetical protein [candidate division WOR-3 bacterium]MCX7947233.1 hypothetical protein [candidate division WOR-3 bacterium]MDW8150288.1 hypothetical protein [candidate division WOR-3 bacterium]